MAAPHPQVKGPPPEIGEKPFTSGLGMSAAKLWLWKLRIMRRMERIRDGRMDSNCCNWMGTKYPSSR